MQNGNASPFGTSFTFFSGVEEQFSSTYGLCSEQRDWDAVSLHLLDG